MWCRVACSEDCFVTWIPSLHVGLPLHIGRVGMVKLFWYNLWTSIPKSISNMGLIWAAVLRFHSAWVRHFWILIMKANEMHFLRFIWYSTLRVSDMSTVHHQEYLNTVYTQWVFVILVLLASASMVLTTRMTNTYCMYTVLRYSWTVDMSETRGVLYQINLRNSASHRLSLQECITM